MRAFLILLLVPLCNCVTLANERANIISKSKVELSPMLITCGLNDIAIIPAPVVDTKSLYYLYKPNGDIIQLNIPRIQKKNKNYSDDFDNLVAKSNPPYVKSIYPIKKCQAIGTLADQSGVDLVRESELSMNENEFMIGPLLEEDHGNWVLNVYFKDIDDGWMELFQIITVEIFESVPLVPSRPRLAPGDTLRLSFAYPIRNLTSCELSAPRSTFDRFFDRSSIDLDRCGYVVHNVTKADAGVWNIIGIGNMVFEGHANLHVLSGVKTDVYEAISVDHF